MDEYGKLIECIQTEIEQISASAGLPEGFLTLTDKKDGLKSLWIVEPLSNSKSKRILSTAVKGRKGNKYLSLIVKTEKIAELAIPEDAEIVPDTSDDTNSSLNFQQVSDPIKRLLHDLIYRYVDQFEPSDKFGCCHRYKECSDAGKCLHPNQFYARACWYRKNLEAGNIFF